MTLPLLAASDFNPVSEFTDFINSPYVNLPLGLDINKAVVYIWMSGALAIVLTLLVVRRGLELRPGRSQTAAEAVYDVAYTQIAKAGLPAEGMRIWFPYVASAFMFIWMMNLIGFIPLPFGSEKVDIAGLHVPKLQIYAATANLSVTLSLTLVTILASHIEGIRYNGPLKYFKSWMPSGMPAFGFKTAPLIILIALIEVISQFVRIVSLSFRLFFNLLAGHLVIAVFLAMGALIGGVAFYFIQPIGLIMGVALFTLEATLIAALQAFIFASLSAIYIGGAIHPDH
ncbi:MAG: F-type H+-transporting ATPase subunit a [Gaiellales bacterium]|nr:F-type H+-transporting ATPase subunit a [Gaiellales bacterium]